MACHDQRCRMCRKRAVDSVEQLGKDDGGEIDGMTKAELPLFV